MVPALPTGPPLPKQTVTGFIQTPPWSDRADLRITGKLPSGGALTSPPRVVVSFRSKFLGGTALQPPLRVHSLTTSRAIDALQTSVNRRPCHWGAGGIVRHPWTSPVLKLELGVNR